MFAKEVGGTNPHGCPVEKGEIHQRAKRNDKSLSSEGASPL